MDMVVVDSSTKSLVADAQEQNNSVDVVMARSAAEIRAADAQRQSWPSHRQSGMTGTCISLLLNKRPSCQRQSAVS